MYKKLVVAISVALLSQVSFAEKCPSVQDIKDRNIQGWSAYDSEDGSRLTPRRWNRFRNNIEEFAMAEWIDENHKGGTIHCYYKNKNGGDLEAFLAKNRYSPNKVRNLWYQVSGSWQCAAGWEKCEFDRNAVVHRPKFAGGMQGQQPQDASQPQPQQNMSQPSNVQSMQYNAQPTQQTNVPQTYPQYPQQPSQPSNVN